MTQKKKRFSWGTLGLVLLGLWLVTRLINPLVTVPAGQRAVLFSLTSGTLQRQLNEGIHFIVPFVQRPIFYDVRSQTYTMSSQAWDGEIRGDDSLRVLTSDGQEVVTDVSVRFHPNRDTIYRLHQRIGPDYINKIIRPAVRSQARIAISAHPVTDVYSSKREAIQNDIARKLTAELAKDDIVLDEVLLRNVQFSPAFAKAVEDKQIAQQNAQRMQYILQKAEKEKKKRILEAQGEAKAIELKGRAIAQNQKVVQYEYARKIAPNVSNIVTDGQSATVPFATGNAKP